MSLILTTIAKNVPVGGYFRNIFEVAFDSSYPTGGESLTPNDLGFQSVKWAEVTPTGAFTFKYDVATKKLLAYNMGQGVSEQALTLVDVKGATLITGAMGTADQAADVVNPGAICALQTFTQIIANANVLAKTANPDCPRNVVVGIKNDSGGALNLYEGTQTATVVGKFRGAAQTEAIAIVSTGANKAVANSKFRAWAGVKPFDSVTSVTFDHTDGPGAGLKAHVAPGVKIGLPFDTATGADADILSFAVTAVQTTIASAFDYTNKTVSVGTIADAADVYVLAKSANIATGAEVTASTDLSTLTGVRIYAYSRYRN